MYSNYALEPAKCRFCRLWGCLMSRPRGSESGARTKEFLRLIVGGRTLRQAAAEANVDPARALHLLDDPAVLAVVVAARAEAA